MQCGLLFGKLRAVRMRIRCSLQCFHRSLRQRQQRRQSLSLTRELGGDAGVRR
jgi:hypothetical protein